MNSIGICSFILIRYVDLVLYYLYLFSSRFSYLQVVFDRDPAPQVEEYTVEELQHLKSEAILKNFKTEQTTFVAYLVPKKRKRDTTDDQQEPQEEEYQWIREYQYEVKTGSESMDTYFFEYTPDSVTYNEISTRVTLSKLKIQKVLTSYIYIYSSLPKG